MAIIPQEDLAKFDYRKKYSMHSIGNSYHDLLVMLLCGAIATWHKTCMHFYLFFGLFIYLFPHDAWWVPIRYPSGIMRPKRKR
jgi:hypothetical protein